MSTIASSSSSSLLTASMETITWSLLVVLTILHCVAGMTVTSTIPINNTSSTSDVNAISDEERKQYLQQLQSDTTKIMIPAMVFLIILAVTGLVGNSLVMFVYSQKFKRSATRILIISIALFDLVANVLAIPGDIYDMFHIWDFNNPGFCRARMFFSAFTTLSSAMALLAVAVIRYRKICTPHYWQITICKAKVISVVVGVLGIVFSIPYAILNGRQTKMTPRPGISAYECTTDDEFANTRWPLMNYGFFLLLFICCCGPLTVLYILIGVQAWKHSKIHGGASTPSSSNGTTTPGSKFSGAIDKTKESNVTIKVSEPVNVKKVYRSRSTDASECNSADEKDHEATPGSKVLEGPEQYTVSFFKDRVEIRTPMMGEFIVNLQKASSGVEDLTNDQEHMLVSPQKNLQETDCDVDSCEEMEHSAIDDARTTRQAKDVDKTCDTRCFDDGDNETYNINNKSNTDVKPREIIFIQNSHSDMTEAGIECIGLSPKPANGDKSPDDLTGKNAYSRQSSVQSDFSQLSSDIDPVAALKWVDIVYCQEGSQTTANPKENGTELSFRISPSNHLLQKTEWLRNMIAEALSKSTKSKQIEGLAESKVGDILKSQMKGCERAKNVDQKGQSSSTENSGPQKTLSANKRLKKFVTKRSSVLKIGSTRSKVRRRPIGRTTIMLIIISAIYALGFMPHLGLMFFKFICPDKYATLTSVELTFYNLFVRTFFLNCAANPIIYSLCDLNFRKECISLLKCFSRRSLH